MTILGSRIQRDALFERRAEHWRGWLERQAESEETTRTILHARKYLSDLERIVQLLRRKFEAYGTRGSIGRWWPDVPEDFPEPGEVRKLLRQIEQRLPEVQHEIIRLEQERSDASLLAEETGARLDAESAGEELDELRQHARQLLETRRALLDRLVQSYGRYSNQLVELETLAGYFLAEVEKVEAFLYERALLVRSVPKPQRSMQSPWHRGAGRLARSRRGCA